MSSGSKKGATAIMDQQAAENIAVVVGIVVAVSLALTQAVGGLVTYLVEAVKGTGLVKDGYSGVVAIVIGMLLGMGLTGLADGMAEESYSLGTLLLLGAFAGALMAAGSVKTFKAMGDVNTTASYSEGLAHGERVANATSQRTDMATMTDLDNVIRLMRAELAELHRTSEITTEIETEVDWDAEDWGATVEELSRIDQLTDAELAAAAEAKEAGLADGPAEVAEPEQNRAGAAEPT